MKKRKLHECNFVDLESSVLPIDTRSSLGRAGKCCLEKRIKFNDKIEMLIYEKPAISNDDKMDYEIEYDIRKKEIKKSIIKSLRRQQEEE